MFIEKYGNENERDWRKADVGWFLNENEDKEVILIWNSLRFWNLKLKVGKLRFGFWYNKKCGIKNGKQESSEKLWNDKEEISQEIVRRLNFV